MTNKMLNRLVPNKKWIYLVLFSVIIFNIFYVPNIDASLEELDTKYDYILGAHRGSSKSQIENTIFAFEEALNNESYLFIEFDVQYTKDKKVVIYHDTNLLRMQKQSIGVDELTYEELSEISRYSVPLYEDVMKLVANKKRLNIEVKSQGNLTNDIELANFLFKDCKERGILEETIFSSTSADVVKYLKSTYPELQVGQIFLANPSTYFHLDSLTESFYERVYESDADYIMMHAINLRNIDSLIRLKPANKKLVFWYFDNQMYIIN